jgi:hypothetical protein
MPRAIEIVMAVTVLVVEIACTTVMEVIAQKVATVSIIVTALIAI